MEDVKINLDEIMATKVLGWVKASSPCAEVDFWYTQDTDPDAEEGTPDEPVVSVEEFKPTEDWKYAGMILETLEAEYQYLHFRLYSREKTGYEVNFIHNYNGRKTYVGFGTSAPEAICVAATRLVCDEE